MLHVLHFIYFICVLCLLVRCTFILVTICTDDGEWSLNKWNGQGLLSCVDVSV
jgi:hypothetical protein